MGFFTVYSLQSNESDKSDASPHYEGGGKLSLRTEGHLIDC